MNNSSQTIKTDDFAQIYDDNINDIYRFIFFKVSNKEEAQDIASTVFLKAWDYLQKKKVKGSIRALLYTIARNLIIDYYRSHKKNISLDNEDNYIQIVDEKQDPIKELEIKISLEVVRKKLPLLKEEYREIIILRYINELDLEEIAEILKKRGGNIRVLLHRAMESLKKLLEE